MASTVTVPAPSRRVWAFVAVALIAVSVGFGLGSKAQPTDAHRPTAAEVRELARTQAQAGTLSCWLQWRESKSGSDEGRNEVVCADLASHRGDER